MPDGIHLVITRAEAKRLFAQKEDSGIRTVVSELIAAKRVGAPDQICEGGNAWDPIHRCLTDGTLAADAEPFPINHCILGGRPLQRGDDLRALLVRPDVTRHVAAELARLDPNAFQARFFQLERPGSARSREADFARVSQVLAEISRLYQCAAQQSDAVLFWLEPETNAHIDGIQ